MKKLILISIFIFLLSLLPTYAVNQLPIVSFNASESIIQVGRHIHFDASESYDPDGSIVNYKWEFGDGEYANTVTPTLYHFYSLSGTHTVKLTLTDNNGNTSSTTKTITVLPMRVQYFIPRTKFYSFGWDWIGNTTIFYDEKNPWSETGYDFIGYRVKIPEIGYEKNYTMTIRTTCHGENPPYCVDAGPGLTNRTDPWISIPTRITKNTMVNVVISWRGHDSISDFVLYNTTFNASIEASVPEGVDPFEITSIQPPSEMFMARDGTRYYSFESLPITLKSNAKNYHYICTSGDIYGTCLGNIEPLSTFNIDGSLSINYWDSYPSTANLRAIISSQISGTDIHSITKNFNVSLKPGSSIYIYSYLKPSESSTDKRPIGGVQITAVRPDGKISTGTTHASFIGPPGTYTIKVPATVDRYWLYPWDVVLNWVNKRIYFSSWNDGVKSNERNISLSDYEVKSFEIHYITPCNGAAPECENKLPGTWCEGNIKKTCDSNCQYSQSRLGDLGGGVPPTFFNFDGVINGKDQSLFLMCYKGTASPQAMQLCDLGGGVPPQLCKFDGVVDGKDLTLFLNLYKSSVPSFTLPYNINATVPFVSFIILVAIEIIVVALIIKKLHKTSKKKRKK